MYSRKEMKKTNLLKSITGINISYQDYKKEALVLI